MKKAVAYYRVSTDKQGKSRLGLEAQRAAITNYARYSSIDLVHEFTEVESGKKNDRPILSQALQYCRKNKATLVIAKLDRLGRNLAFIAALMDSKVEFVAVDNPHANRLHLHIMAAFAEHEREQISDRTKAALQAAKQRGTILGKQGHVLATINAAEAERFAAQLRPCIEELAAQGITTGRAIRDELNRRNVPTFRNGSTWHLYSVQNVLKRLATG